jgi:membrane associated rhomboid family serine protease
MFFLPLNVDVPMNRLPVANWLLIGLIAGMTVIGWNDRKVYYWMAGLERRTPARAAADVNSPEYFDQKIQEVIDDALGVGRVFDPPPWKLPIVALTSSLMHGGLFHLLGNLLFLWVFGNAVNYKLGHPLFLGLYCTGAILAGLASYLIVPGCAAVGASGAIMCLMGAFLVFFPRNDITLIVPASPALVWAAEFRLSSWIVIAVWIGLDIVCLACDVQNRISYPAHVTGFGVGAVVAWFLASTRIVRPTRYEQTLLQVFGLDRSNPHEE